MTTAAQLLKEAEAIEAHAKDQLPGWIILGTTEKYSDAMDEAAKLRRAAGMTTANRNAFLRQA